jgi:hypothetical protein
MNERSAGESGATSDSDCLKKKKGEGTSVCPVTSERWLGLPVNEGQPVINWLSVDDGFTGTLL